MANAVEYAYPGDKLTFTADGTITGGQVVKSNGGTFDCVVSTEDADTVLGVALYDAVSGGLVSVASRGVYYLTADGAINAGEKVVTGSVAGTVKTIPAAGGTYALADTDLHARVVGIALEDGTDTNTLRVKLTNLG